MPRRSLPENPSFENIKKQAKTLLKAVRAGEADALVAVRELHPRAEAALADFKLSDAQLATARSYGFVSWPKLKQRVAVAEEFGYDPWGEKWQPTPSESLADRFIRLACLDYGNWRTSHAEKAARLLVEHPELTRAHIHAAAAAGDVAAVRALLARDPALVDRRGGPYRWEPILHACYSRLDSTDPRLSTLEAVRVLLEHGADPNAGLLWWGTYPFTCLTGAFGEGEDSRNQPPHRDRDALARVLLDAGADPNDSQVLYNRHFRADDGHLKLLFEYGLGHDKGGPWSRRLDRDAEALRGLLVDELCAAAESGKIERVRLLVEHGVDVDRRGDRHGRTAYELARLGGHRTIADYLRQNGARETVLSPKDAFIAACAEGRVDEARALLAAHRTLLEDLGHDGRVDAVFASLDAQRAESLAFLAGLGVDLNAVKGNFNTALHAAAMDGRLEMVQQLVALGADPNRLEARFHATPLGWALYGGQAHVVEYLLPLTTRIIDAVRADSVTRVRELLTEDASRAQARDGGGHPVFFHLHPGLRHLDEIAALLVAHGGDINARGEDGRTCLDAAATQYDDAFVERLRRLGAKPGPP